jgi:hypothetical protein
MIEIQFSPDPTAVLQVNVSKLIRLMLERLDFHEKHDVPVALI